MGFGEVCEVSWSCVSVGAVGLRVRSCEVEEYWARLVEVHGGLVRLVHLG